MNKELTTKEAVKSILRTSKCSKYWLAHQLGVQPIMVSNYIRDKKPSRMSKRTADKMSTLFAITITDVYNPIKEIK